MRDGRRTTAPVDWTCATLGEHFTLQRGFDITVAEQRPGNIPVVSSSGITSFHDRAAVEGPGVVIGRKGKLGDAFFVAGSFWPHDTTLWVKNFHGNDRRFCATFLKWMRLDRFDAATSVPTLNRNFVHPLSVAIPPLPEQRQITVILDTVDDAIRKTEQIVAKLQQVKQGLLHDLLTRGVNDSGELRDPERHPEQFKGSPLGHLSKEWDVCVLDDVAEVRSGIAKNDNRRSRGAQFVHYLRVANVQDGYLDLSEVSQIPVNGEELERYRLASGDVLMNEGGDLDKLGRGTMWRGEYDPCVHQNHVFAVRCGSRMRPEFLNVWTGSSAARRYFMVAGKQTTNLASINKTSLGRLPVVVPAREEQNAIVAILAEHERRASSETTSLAKLRLLKQGLMDDLLTGRVRVTPLLAAGAP
jgi:type I restriction enzyme S subunit